MYDIFLYVLHLGTSQCGYAEITVRYFYICVFILQKLCFWINYYRLFFLQFQLIFYTLISYRSPLLQLQQHNSTPMSRGVQHM